MVPPPPSPQSQCCSAVPVPGGFPQLCVLVQLQQGARWSTHVFIDFVFELPVMMVVKWGWGYTLIGILFKSKTTRTLLLAI